MSGLPRGTTACTGLRVTPIAGSDGEHALLIAIRSVRFEPDDGFPKFHGLAVDLEMRNGRQWWLRGWPIDLRRICHGVPRVLDRRAGEVRTCERGIRGHGDANVADSGAFAPDRRTASCQNLATDASLPGRGEVPVLLPAQLHGRRG